MNHYNQEYFNNYQSSIGEFGGIANLFKFESFIRPNDKLLDFGCGGGYLLKNISCQHTFGFDVNPVALEKAKSQGLIAVSDLSLIPDNLDIIISNHALEHVPNPLDSIKQVRTKLRPGGLLVFVVPYENQCPEWNPQDVNKHLYTWAPLNLGNLFEAAGCKVLSCKPLYHTWPPNYQEIVQKEGWEKFHQACVEYAQRTQTYQVRVVAERG